MLIFLADLSEFILTHVELWVQITFLPSMQKFIIYACCETGGIFLRLDRHWNFSSGRQWIFGWHGIGSSTWRYVMSGRWFSIEEREGLLSTMWFRIGQFLASIDKNWVLLCFTFHLGACQFVNYIISHQFYQKKKLFWKLDFWTCFPIIFFNFGLNIMWRKN